MTDKLTADTPIWRYMSFWQFASMILGDQNTLWFSRPFKFNDKWEGLCPPSFFNNMRRSGTRDGEESLRKMEAMRRYGYFVNCWHINDHESDAMWRLYGLAPFGVAIQSTVGMIEHRCLDIYGADVVRYYKPTDGVCTTTIDRNELILLKREDFEWEHDFV